MSQEGYTLAETMAALVMIGLAIGGLGQATFLIGRLNHAAGAKVADGRHVVASQRALDDLMAQAGPFRAVDSAGFHGRERGFDFLCEGGRVCGAELVTTKGQTVLVVRRRGRATASRRLGDLRAPRFLYRDINGVHDAWPVAGVVSADKVTLGAVALVDGRQAPVRPVAVATIWAQQAAACIFDSVSGECREVAQ